jgi:hypothetical protein
MRERKMKRILLTLCVFIALASLANAEFYDCVDKDGNTFLTDNPPQDAKCKSKGGGDESANQQQQSDIEVQQKTSDDKTTSQKEEIKRLKNIPRPSY